MSIKEVERMPELIRIIYEKPRVGFGKSQKVECPGVKFADGQIAYLDEDSVIQASENGSKLKKALTNAVIEVL